MLSSLRTMLAGIVDYAGLFPPAAIALQKAMQNYEQYQQSPYAWMLGRFILPAARLAEFEALLPTFPGQSWQLSIILPGRLEEAWAESLAANIASIQAHPNSPISVTALEFPPLPVAEIERVLLQIPTGIEPFFEIPLHQDLAPYLAVLQQTGAAAKIRTGGITVDAFPKADQLGQFILACAKAQVPFKATAGLHHPLPANHPITYEPNSPTTRMYGFLNVAVLATLAYTEKITLEVALEILQAPSIQEFQFKSEGVEWRQMPVSLGAIATARQQGFRAFGSCSFQEPIADLQELLGDG